MTKELGAGESLFKNEESLDPEWLPKNLPFREQQHHNVANIIKPLLQNRNGRTAIITGAPGIGKTAAVKLVLRELEDTPDASAPDIHVIYVNCWQKNSTYKIFVDICEQLGYKFTQNKNTEDLFKLIQNMVNKSAAVFAFDEVDKVADVDFLYNIYTDIYKKSIILITNNSEWYSNQDERIKSRVIPERIEFKPYSKEELKGILKYRAEFAFLPNSVDDKVLDLIAEATLHAGDIRAGLLMLREAGLAAEDSNSRKLTIEHAQKAVGRLDTFTTKPETDLEEDAKAILQLIKQNNEMKIGDLFKIYQEQDSDANYKTFQRRIERLSQGGYIDTKKVVGGKEGTTTMISSKNKQLSDF